MRHSYLDVGSVRGERDKSLSRHSAGSPGECSRSCGQLMMEQEMIKEDFGKVYGPG